MGRFRARLSSQNKRKDYFGKLKFMFKVIGVSLEGNDSRAYKVYSFLLILCIDFTYTFLAVLEIFKYDIKTVIQFLIYPLAMVMALCKTLVVMRNRTRLGKLLNKLEQEPFLPNRERGGEVEEKLMKNCASLINTQNNLFWGSISVTFLIGIVMTLTKRIKSSDYHDWQFPYGPFSAINVTYSPNYEIAWCYQNISAAVMILHFSGCDLVILAVLAHVTFQFKILQKNIRRIVEISYGAMLQDTGWTRLSATNNSDPTHKVDASKIHWKYYKKSLAGVINYHLAIIDIASEVEYLFNGLLLFVFLNTLGLNCLAVYEGLTTPFGDPQLPLAIGGGLAACGPVFAICFWGEQVMHESREVGRAAFESNFVGSDLRFQKALALIIRRSQNPTAITAGKFAVVNLSTFTWILRASYSAFTVLRSAKQ